MDADLLTTRAALEAIPDMVQLSGLAEAEVVHSVWDFALRQTPRETLAGKRIVCHACTDVFSMMEDAAAAGMGEVVGRWVAPSTRAAAALGVFELPAVHVPYAVMPGVFYPCEHDGLDRAGLRREYGVPAGPYVIANFMRDSLGADLSRPKWEKGPELLVEVCQLLARRGRQVHVLLAGPRRHWVRGRLDAAGVPFTFVGQVVDGDDQGVNILPPETVARLYQCADLHLVTSRSEGGPRAIVEAAAVRTAQLSTPVGVAPDVLLPGSVFTAVDEAVARIEEDIARGALQAGIPAQYERVRAFHVPLANAARFRALYGAVGEIPVLQPACRAPRRAGRSGVRMLLARAGRLLPGRVRSILPAPRLHVGLWHEFHKPPYGGGNQFMLALHGELQRLGVRVSVNRMSPAVDVHICNSVWFDVACFEEAALRFPVRMIHRIDGPVALVRGVSWEIDEEIQRINERFAAATVFQSPWCMSAMRRHGLSFRRPMIIGNAVDGRLFHPPRSRALAQGRPVRLISSSWSDNPRKGGALFKWLDAHLDWTRFEYTFIGRVQESFRNIRHVPPQDSRRLGELLRESDIYLAASENEPCSNALLEALASGLPTLYFNSGSHGDLVGQGGLAFNGREDVLSQLDRLVNCYDSFQACITVRSMREIALRYLELAEELMR